MMIIKKNSKQYKENVSKQLFLNNNGVKVKIDGSWGPWLQKLYDRLITRLKEYQRTPLGLLTALTDKLTGNNTYKILPAEVKEDKRSAFGRKADSLLLHSDNALGYIWLNVVPTAGVAGILANPTVGLRMAVPATVSAVATSAATNAASKALTGKTTEELAEPITGTELSFLGNPASYTTPKVAYNFKNFGRYVLNNTLPASYSWKSFRDILKSGAIASNPFSKVPTFHNGKRPNWFKKGTFNGDLQARLENAAEWIGIPEEEIPRIETFSNGDGTRGFKFVRKRAILPDVKDAKNAKDNKVVDVDLVFGPGGEHSDFTLKANTPQGNLWLYEDNQIINPLYKITDALIKTPFSVNAITHPKINKFVDYFAGKDLKWMLGFDNDVKYKQYLYETGSKTNNKIFPMDNSTVDSQYK